MEIQKTAIDTVLAECSGDIEAAIEEISRIDAFPVSWDTQEALDVLLSH